jgi:glycosyltransferase involved in cell wall biosynthesis
VTSTYDICIVSSGCLSTGPRVEKEADALGAAGYRVAVVVAHWAEGQPEWDARIAAGRPWRLLPVEWLARTRKTSLGGIGSVALHRAARRACLIGLPAQPLLASLASSDRAAPLALQTLRVPARLYIAHNLAALPAALLAARVRRAAHAFDAEDDHLGELSAAQQQGGEGRIVQAIMEAGLRSAAFVTAASDGIARAIAVRHSIGLPTTVLNAFPVSLRDRLDGQRRDRRGAGLSVVWYSQTVGLDRGLQDVIAALGRVRGETELHVRGTLDPDVEFALLALARNAGVDHRLFFHPQVHPDELLSRVAEHDVGLALEQDVSDNRLIAVTNKLLFYMLAGVAIVATGTPGQRGIAEQAGGALELYSRGDVAALSAQLQRFVDDPAHLAACKRRSLALAQTRFNAERELQKLLPLVARALSVPQG